MLSRFPNAHHVSLLLSVGKIEEVVLEARTVERQAGSYKMDDSYINGMPEYTVEIKEHIPVNISMVIFGIDISNIQMNEWRMYVCIMY